MPTSTRLRPLAMTLPSCTATYWPGCVTSREGRSWWKARRSRSHGLSSSLPVSMFGAGRIDRLLMILLTFRVTDGEDELRPGHLLTLPFPNRLRINQRVAAIPLRAALIRHSLYNRE